MFITKFHSLFKILSDLKGTWATFDQFDPDPVSKLKSNTANLVQYSNYYILYYYIQYIYFPQSCCRMDDK